MKRFAVTVAALVAAARVTPSVEEVGRMGLGWPHASSVGPREGPRRPLAALSALALALAVALLAALTAYAASSYPDPAGDANEAPDIASVTVRDSGSGAVTVSVSLANFAALPASSRILLRFDLDESEETGAQGDEVVVRYSSEGTLELLRWDGSAFAAVPASGMTARLSDGVLEYTLERQLLRGAASVGLIAVAARTQQVGAGLVTSTDFAPGSGRHVFTLPGSETFPDPEGDHDVAPDITSISVSDSPAGTVSFRLTTVNYATLPPDKLIGIGIDLAGRPDRDDGLFLGYLSGSETVELDREQGGVTAPVEPPFGAAATHEDGVLTFSLERRKLDGASAFGFGIVSADLVGPGESEGEEFEGEVEALDSAPDDLSSLYRYQLSSPGPLRLRAGAVAVSRTGPRFGKPFTIGLGVRRLDTYRLVRSGSVRCSATIGGSQLRVSGRFRGARAECRMNVPLRKGPAVLQGTIVVRVAGASHRSSFRYIVR